MFRRKKVLSQTGIDVIIDTTYDNFPSMPREFDTIFDFVLRGYNTFALTYINCKEEWLKPQQIKETIIPACLVSFEDVHQKVNGKYHLKIAEGLIDYWLLSSKNEGEDAITFLQRCLLVSGIIKFFCLYDHVPQKTEKLLDTQEKIVKVLESGGDKNGLINNILGCLPEGFYISLKKFSNVCTYKYGSLNKIHELDDLFITFKNSTFRSKK